MMSTSVYVFAHAKTKQLIVLGFVFISLGNYVRCALMKLLPGSSKVQKMRHFLLATTPILFQMLLFHMIFWMSCILSFDFGWFALQFKLGPFFFLFFKLHKSTELSWSTLPTALFWASFAALFVTGAWLELWCWLPEVFLPLVLSVLLSVANLHVLVKLDLVLLRPLLYGDAHLGLGPG